jgi:hypothetical protein
MDAGKWPRFQMDKCMNHWGIFYKCSLTMLNEAQVTDPLQQNPTDFLQARRRILLQWRMRSIFSSFSMCTCSHPWDGTNQAHHREECSKTNRHYFQFFLVSTRPKNINFKKQHGRFYHKAIYLTFFIYRWVKKKKSQKHTVGVFIIETPFFCTSHSWIMKILGYNSNLINYKINFGYLL